MATFTGFNYELISNPAGFVKRWASTGALAGIGAWVAKFWKGVDQ